MITLNKSSSNENKIEGIEYSGLAQEDIKKNELCYMQGGFGFESGNISFLNQEFFDYNWIQLDEDRLAIIMVKKLISTSNPALNVRICSFNDGEDKLTNPFINHVTTQIYDNFVYNENYSSSIVKLDIPNREIIAFKHGIEVYFFEVINKTEKVVFLVKGSSDSVVPLSTSYTEMFPLPYKYVTDDTTYNFVDFYFDKNILYATKYSFASSNGKLLSKKYKLNAIGSGSNHQLLKVIKLSEYEYVAVIAYLTSSSTPKTFICYYLITMDNINYEPSGMEAISDSYTTSGNFVNLYCSYQDNMFIITGNLSTNKNILGVIIIDLFKTNKSSFNIGLGSVVYAKAQTEIKHTSTYFYDAIQNCIMYGNQLFIYIVYSSGLIYGVQNMNNFSSGGWYEFDTIDKNAKPTVKTKASQSVVPIIRKDMVYNLYMSSYSGLQILYCGLVKITSPLIYPATFNNYINLKQIGLAKDNYIVGEQATIIHPEPYRKDI